MPTKTVTLTDSNSSVRQATVDLKLGTLQLTKGSWDQIGLDSNNVNVGPNQYLIQIHVKNNAVTTANNVISTLSFTSANAYVNIAPGETTVKNLGNIAPGQTVDVFYLIEINRNAAAYDTIRNFTVTVAGSNTGSPADTISGSLYVRKLVSQNRNDVVSITSTNSNPSLGDIIAVTMVSTTASSTYDVVNLPLTNYDPTILMPINMTTTFGSNVTNNISIITPGQNQFVSVWYFKIIGTGVTNLYGLITDKSGNSYHYNDDFGENIVVNAIKRADLAITKTVNNTAPVLGQNVAFTITVINNGPNNATLVRVLDPLPVGLTYVSSNATQGSYNPANGTWNIGNLPVNGTAILTLIATVGATGQITNIANVTGNETDPDLTNNQAIAVLNSLQPTADLAIQKTVDNASPNNGDIVNYLIHVFNAGPDTANNVVVTDVLPSGLILISAIPSQGTYNSVTGVWTIGSLLSGASANLSIQAQTTRIGNITNAANVTSTTYDPHPEDNNSTVTINVKPTVDLQTIKIVNTTSPNVGQNVLFTITVKNNGPDNGTGVILDDLLPSGLIYVSSIASQGSFDNNTGLWTIGNLANGSSVTLNITATVNQTGQIDNIASVSGNEYDPNPLNNQDIASLNGQPSADLSVTKTADPMVINNGQTTTFTITVFNAGPSTATGVVLSDLLPVGLSLVSATPSQGSYNSGTGVWTIGTLNHGLYATLSLIVQATKTGFITNIANVSGNEFDPHPGDNIDAVTIQVNPTADMAVIKSVNSTTPNVGQNIKFLINVTNLGPDTATGVTISDLLPAGLVFISANPSQGSYNSATGVWNVGTLISGASAVLNITALVNQTGQLINIATVSANEFDPDETNNQDLVVINGQPTADLAVTKTANPLNINNGQTLSFTINVFNAGPSTATGVVLSDLLPVGLSLVSATPSQGSYNSGTGVWTIGTLNHLATATMIMVVQATQTGSFTNMVNVTGNEFDPHPDDNNASVTVSVNPSADLAVVKSVNSTTPNLGDNISFTITVTNNGPDDATSVNMNDLLPAGLVFISSNATQGSYDSNSGIWDIGNLNNGFSAVLTVNALVNKTGNITNIAMVSGNEFDPDETNNQDIVIINGNPASDLSIQKVSSPNTIYNGQTATFTITVFNAGPDNDTGVVVNDLLPAGLSWVSDTPSQGSYNHLTGVWTIGNLAHEASATLTIVVRGIATGTFTNMANVTGDLFDPHTEDNNASSTLDVLPVADIAVNKTASNYSPEYTKNVTFTITVINNGPNTATGVSVSDLLPAGLTYISSSTSQGNYNSGSGLWTIGTLINGATATLNILAQVNVSNTTLTNIAIKSSENEFDNNTDNDASEISLQIPPASELKIIKTVNKSKVKVGSTIKYTITVSNNGPDSALNTVVFDDLPATMQYLSSIASQGSYDPNSGIWTIGTMSNGATATLQIFVKVLSPGTFQNVATVSSSSSNPGNNSSSTVVDVIGNGTNGTNGSSGNVPMQDTGVPMALLAFAIVAMVAGMVIPKRKN